MFDSFRLCTEDSDGRVTWIHYVCGCVNLLRVSPHALSETIPLGEDEALVTLGCLCTLVLREEDGELQSENCFGGLSHDSQLCVLASKCSNRQILNMKVFT